MKNNIRVERAILRMTIEAGKYVPSTVLALKMAAVFGKSVNDVFMLDEND